MEPCTLLALSGSLRKASYNTAALKALQLLAPPTVTIGLGCIADLPLFNPDKEGDENPAFERLRLLLDQYCGLIITSPEYAHGISGPLKNALDWLVSGVGFPDKPVMLINTSPRAIHAEQALKEVLVTMSANIIDQAYVSIPLLGSELDATGIREHPENLAALRSGLDAFCLQIDALNTLD